MNTTNRIQRTFINPFKGVHIRRGTAWGLIILGALAAFEIFNYSTTQFALNDVLGDLKFAGLRWATILALAFCGIDFAGLARLFTPEQGREEPAEVWYLAGAWFLAATMNAILTWWGVAVAIASHSNLSSEVLSATTLTKVVPVFVAIMVWLIRILIIGTFSVKGGKIFSQSDSRTFTHQPASMQPASSLVAHPHPSSLGNLRPASKVARPESGFARAEPAYRNLPVQAKPAREAEYVDTPRNS